MEYFVHSLTALFLLFCCCNCMENTTTTDGTIRAKTSLEKGMEPVFELTRNFLETVFSVDFYEDNDGAFTESDLNRIIKENDYAALQQDWQKVFKTFGGYSACIVMGLLFMFAMPIIGLIFCCCNCCCHRCGNSKEHHDPIRAKCKRTTYTTLLLIFTTMMLAGGIITFLTSELLHQSLKNQDNAGFVGQVQDNLDVLDGFVDKTVKEIITDGKMLVEDGTDKILPRIRDAALTTAQKVKNTINATEILDSTKKLGEAATKAFEDVQNLNTSLSKLKDLQFKVTSTLDGIRSSCNISACASISNLTFDPNYTLLSNLQTQAGKLKNAQQINNSVNTANNEFNRVSASVNDTVKSFITEAESQAESLRKSAVKEIDKLNTTADPFRSQMRNVKADVSKAGDDIANVGKYIWYGCIGVGCVVMLVVTFYYLGVLFGLCGERPGYNAACCNRGTGANLLCTGVCCSFLFSWLLMLVVVLTFTGGSVMYSLGCKHLHPVENVEVFENMVSDSFDVNISKTLNITGLTIAGSLRACKDNEGLYVALKLDNVFNIDKEFNLSDVKSEVYKMANSTNFSVGNITLLSTNLVNELDDFLAAGLTSVNFTQYTVELDKDPVPSLDRYINDSRKAAAAAQSGTPEKELLETTANQLEEVKNKQLVEVSAESDNLKTVVADLERSANVTTQVAGLKTSLKASEDQFNENKDRIINQGMSEAVVAIVDSIDDVVSNTKTSIKTAGKCRPLYDATQGFVDAACVSILDPFNGIWFGLGWSLFFTIPCFIFAILLMDLYRRTDRYVKKETFDDPNHSAYAGYDGYRGGDDNIPLTRRNNAQSPQSNGAHNYAYEGREPKNDPRYHRDSQSGYPSHGSPMYAQPYAGNRAQHGYDAPPHYDDAVAQPYRDNHGPTRGTK